VAKDREGHATYDGVCDCGTETKDDLATWETREPLGVEDVRVRLT